MSLFVLRDFTYEERRRLRDHNILEYSLIRVYSQLNFWYDLQAQIQEWNLQKILWYYLE